MDPPEWKRTVYLKLENWKRRTWIWIKETGGSTTEWTRGTPEQRYI
jgi:hypothetical protein